MPNFEAVCSQGHQSKCDTTNEDGQARIFAHNCSLDHAREQRKVDVADRIPFSQKKAKAAMPYIPPGVYYRAIFIVLKGKPCMVYAGAWSYSLNRTLTACTNRCV